MPSVTYAIDRTIALLIREILRGTPLAREWEHAVMWNHDHPVPRASEPPSPPHADAPRLHVTVSVELLERLTLAVFTSEQNAAAYAWSSLSRREVSTYVHRMQISAKRRLNVWD